MPTTTVHVYRPSTGVVPLTDWLERLEKHQPKVYVKCVHRIQQLEQKGYELRRPAADHLGEGIYELRVKSGRVNFRVLYFFCGKNVACLTHGFTKEDSIPEKEIDRAKKAKILVETNLVQFTEEWEL